MSRLNELRLMTRVAQMYHVDGMKQSEISAALHMSQATVSRLLKRAEVEGIVKITITPPRGTFPELENELRARYGLNEAIVTDSAGPQEESILSAIGDAAAHFLETTVADGEVIGISSWSASLLRMVDSLHPLKRVKADQVVQMLGGVGNPTAQIHATQLSTRLAQLTGAKPRLLSAPGLAATPGAKRALLADGFVRETLAEFRRISLALVGVGSVEPSKMLAASGNVFTAEELHDLAERGAVGDICLRFYGLYGTPIRTALDERVIGMTLDELRNVPRVVAVAGGSRKVAAIRGALLGRSVNVLITDRFTAEKLLAEDAAIAPASAA